MAQLPAHVHRRLLLSVTVCYCLCRSYPLMFIVARNHALSLARGWVRAPEKMTRPLTAVGVVTTLVVAIGFPSIEAVLGLMGATCSVSLSIRPPRLGTMRLARDGWALVLGDATCGMGITARSRDSPMAQTGTCNMQHVLLQTQCTI